ncbi:MAG TPA: penicillin acylase family protein [Streptosporangiaceae bacterium]|nr:penicillin acylase family protein [Streptosporangiaceae bacterium]
MRRTLTGRAVPPALAAAAVLAVMTSQVPAPAAAGAVSGWVTPTYRAGDYAHGLVRSILPAGENGLVNAAELAQFEATGARPAGSQDQLGPYASLLYAGPGLTDAQLPSYYNDESFGVQPANITATVHPNPKIPVVIYYDQHYVPHIYGATDQAMAYGAGWAVAHDRLFLMDVLRHYGSGTLSEFLGPSCADEQMDHDQLLVADYTPAEANAQINALPTEYGAQGARLVAMGKAYVAGINNYIAATRTDPSLLPADYAAVGAPPQPWTPADIISIASLIGGIFGKGGGGEVSNAALLQYLDRQLGSASAAQAAFTAFKEQNDPSAPTTVTARFPYEVPGTVNPATTAMPDNAAAPLSGGPTDTTPGCNATPPNRGALAVIASLLRLPRTMAMSNALLVDAAHSTTGHPIAVFGPQVGYFAPQILMEEDLHAPDIAAEGAAFPGTSFVVELGRGPDFAWSATSAGSDVVDQRLELVCNPAGGPPAAHGTYYEFSGKCVPMTHHTFTEYCVPKPGGTGGPVVIHHQLYNTVHGIVQGWTTAAGGKPAAVVNQRSTFGHEVDSGVGFLRWNTPSLTTSPQTWQAGAQQVQYTFNWFYVDDQHIAYYQSGLDPVRPSDVDPNLPTWGTGVAEWRGFLPASAHPQAIDPSQGSLTSWNNKPAPGFSAADDNYSFGPVQRVQSLNQEIAHQSALHNGKLTEADLVTAMETAASADLTGRQVVPGLLAETAGRAEPPGVQAMLSQLRTWVSDGALRRKASPADVQYAQAAAIAIMDELWPRLIQAVFDPVFAAGGVQSARGVATGYNVFPMPFEDTPNGGGAHHGSAYQYGWDGYLVKILGQVLGQPVAQPFPPAVTSQVCEGGLAACPAAIDRALDATYQALVTANGGSTDVATWTQDTTTQAAGQTMPAYDDIQFTSVGVIGQPAIDWQNRPTFQQVAQFPAHR